MNSYRYSSDANGDIEKIALYLFDLNPVAACRFLDGLEKACELLAEHPLMGRPRPELAENLRSFPIGNYLSSTRPRRMALTFPAFLNLLRCPRS